MLPDSNDRPPGPDGVARGARLIAVNSLLMYARMAIVMAVNLYTVRVVLRALGVEDFGTYDVVAGLVTVAAVASNVLATSAQRFYSVSMGRRDEGRLRRVFSSSVVLALMMSVLVVLIAETVGMWAIEHYLSIPPGRVEAATQVFHLSVLAFVLGIVHIPFSSAILAHEHLGVYAGVSIGECIAKLVAAALISAQPFDRLVFHGFSLLVISSAVATVFIILASRRYPACRFERHEERGLYREMLSFSGWSFFGSLAGVGLNQVITVLVNVFFGPAVSAARAISVHIGNAISTFTGSLITAVKPALIRSHAEVDHAYLDAVFTLSNKSIFYGLLMVCLPLTIEMDTVLAFWLGVEDRQTILFCRLMVVYAFIMALNNPISIVIQATGRIREYNLIVEFFTLMCVPAVYLLFSVGLDASAAYWAMIASATLAHAARLWCLRRYYPEFDLRKYLGSFLAPGLCISAVVVSASLAVDAQFQGGILRLISYLILSAGLTPILAYLFGLTDGERALVRRMIPRTAGSPIR
jgi:O-antigen/teichoic acid export membrane protein